MSRLPAPLLLTGYGPRRFLSIDDFSRSHTSLSGFFEFKSIPFSAVLASSTVDFCGRRLNPVSFVDSACSSDWAYHTQVHETPPLWSFCYLLALWLGSPWQLNVACVLFGVHVSSLPNICNTAVFLFLFRFDFDSESRFNFVVSTVAYRTFDAYNSAFLPILRSRLHSFITQSSPPSYHRLYGCLLYFWRAYTP